MFGDRERPERQRAEQDRAVATYLRQEVAPYSPFHGRRLARVEVNGVADLRRLPTMRLDDVERPADLVLRPTPEQIAAAGSFDLKSRLAAAKLFNRVGALQRSVIDPLYKPVHWILSGGVPIAYSARDLDRLGEIGRRWLEACGVRTSDAIASLLPTGPHLSYWQLLLGARVGGLSAIGLEPSTAMADVAALAPTVVAGSVSALARLVGEGAAPLPDVRTIIVIGDPRDPRLGPIAGLSARRDVAVVTAWAPPGVRALWAQCRGGTGLHTWPATEVIELDPEPHGEVVWTGTGWAGSAFVRLRTGVAGTLVEGTCPTCGRTTPRLVELANLVPGATPPAATPAAATPAAAKPTAAKPTAAKPAVPKAVAPKAVAPTVAAKPVAASPTAAKPKPAAAKPAPVPAPVAAAAEPEAVEEPLPDFEAVLDGHPDVAEWQVELRTVDGDDEVLVYLAPAVDRHPGRLVRALDRDLDATQFVVLGTDELRRRLTRARGRHVLDRRT